jgi:hypothetical protein
LFRPAIAIEPYPKDGFFVHLFFLPYGKVKRCVTMAIPLHIPAKKVKKIDQKQQAHPARARPQPAPAPAVAGAQAALGQLA